MRGAPRCRLPQSCHWAAPPARAPSRAVRRRAGPPAAACAKRAALREGPRGGSAPFMCAPHHHTTTQPKSLNPKPQGAVRALHPTSHTYNTPHILRDSGGRAASARESENEARRLMWQGRAGRGLSQRADMRQAWGSQGGVEQRGAPASGASSAKRLSALSRRSKCASEPALEAAPRQAGCASLARAGHTRGGAAEAQRSAGHAPPGTQKACESAGEGAEGEGQNGTGRRERPLGPLGLPTSGNTGRAARRANGAAGHGYALQLADAVVRQVLQPKGNSRGAPPGGAFMKASTRCRGGRLTQRSRG